MLRILFFLIFITTPCLSNASNYELELFMQIIDKKSITYPDKNKHMILNGSANWQDSDGDYGVMQCLATITTYNSDDTARLDANCEARNHKNEKFWLNLSGTSDVNAGVGIATYMYGEGKYKLYVGKKCAYAVKYFEDRMFYKQQCKK